MSESERSPGPSSNGVRRSTVVAATGAHASGRNDDAWEPLQLDEPASNEPALLEAARDGPFERTGRLFGFQGRRRPRTDGRHDRHRLQHRECNIRVDALCAERVALVKALSDGHTAFTRIAVVADTEAPTPPCGPCRQLLWEYCGDIEVVLSNLNGPTARLRLAELLPLPFDNRLLK